MFTGVPDHSGCDPGQKGKARVAKPNSASLCFSHLPKARQFEGTASISNVAVCETFCSHVFFPVRPKPGEQEIRFGATLPTSVHSGPEALGGP